VIFPLRCLRDSFLRVEGPSGGQRVGLSRGGLIRTKRNIQDANDIDPKIPDNASLSTSCAAFNIALGI
jgi:hypothetical protein